MKHELNLSLIEQFGPVKQNTEGQDLSQKNFLTEEKVSFYGRIINELFKMADSLPKQ